MGDGKSWGSPISWITGHLSAAVTAITGDTDAPQTYEWKCHYHDPECNKGTTTCNGCVAEEKAANPELYETIEAKQDVACPDEKEGCQGPYSLGTKCLKCQDVHKHDMEREQKYSEP